MLQIVFKMSLDERNSAMQKFEQGVEKLEAGEYNQALRFFLWAIKINPNEEQFYLKQSEGFQLISDYIRGMSSAHNALMLNSNSDKAMEHISECSLHLENEVQSLIYEDRSEDSLEIVNKVLKISPDYVNFNLKDIPSYMSNDRRVDDNHKESIFYQLKAISSERNVFSYTYKATKKNQDSELKSNAVIQEII